MRDYKKLIVWQKSYSFGLHIYTITKKFPKEESYSLTSQLKRSSTSIALNIAEGSNRSTEKDFRSFLYTAYGSGAETEVSLLYAKDLGYISEKDYMILEKELSEIMKMLNSFISKLL